VRRRLLISTLVVAVTAVLLLGVPLAVVMSRLVNDESGRQLQRDATLAATSLQYRLSQHQQEDYGEIGDSLSDDYVNITRNGHRVATFGKRPPSHRVRIGQDTDGAYTVAVEVDSSGVVGRVAGALALVTALALLAVGAAVGLAMLQAQRLIRPLEELAGAAARLGSGDARPLGRRYGLPELDQVAEGLDGSAQRVSDMLAAEREFASDASHQLRTPLTALSMRLEEMIAAADDPAAVRAEGEAALTQTERLAEVVSQLLGRTRHSGGNSPRFAGIDDILSQQVAEWDPAFRRGNRKLELTGEKGLQGYVTAGALSQVIATLLDNALVHGAGAVTIRTSQTPRSVVIEVRDEGQGVPDDLVPRIFERNVSGRPQGTGLGLALARTVAASDGWRVVLVRPCPAVFAVFLPRGSQAETDGQPVVSGPA
jgi:signal transduction histidine kinase